MAVDRAALVIPDVTIAKDAIAGLVYENMSDGSRSNDYSEVLGWVLSGIQISVIGYYTYEWVGDELTEVWHRTIA